jgi:hypothetical protein
LQASVFGYMSSAKRSKEVTASVGDSERLAAADANRECAVRRLDSSDLTLIEVVYIYETDRCCSRAGHLDLLVVTIKALSP